MSSRDYFRLLCDYNRWANERILDRAGELEATQYTAPAGVSFGSIRGTLVHALATEVIWLARCQGVSPRAMLAEEDLPTFDVLRERWRQQDAAQAAFLASVTDADVERGVIYQTTSGREYTTPLGRILAHVVNHGTQFRSEAAVALSELGRSPGDLDLILYLRTVGA